MLNDKIYMKVEDNMNIKKIKVFVVIFSVFLLTGCNLFHGHNYKGATCTEPKTCMECGEKVGEPLGHKFSEATCTEAKTCKACGHTEGEALGHTTDVGKCTRCNNYINLSLVTKDIKNVISVITTNINSATKNINQANYESLSDSYIKFTMAYNDLSPTKDKMDNIIYFCDDIEGLKDLKSKTEATIKVFPNQVNGKSLDDLMTFLDEYEIYLKSWQEVLKEYERILKLYE